jgi:phosphoglycolate phosphatase-like HAD superfamily hydrolase
MVSSPITEHETLTAFEPTPNGPEREPGSTPTSSPPGRRRAEAIHDFSAKLRQPALRPQVESYVSWQRALRAARKDGRPEPETPELVPLSINLDLTTACNYRCDHCIDWEILNSKVRHADETLRRQMAEMAARGMRSVILIGGGEPTLYPGFASFVAHLKSLGLQVAVVSNGSRNDRILDAAEHLGPGDWVRLSLDAASDAVFRAMHKPTPASLGLDEICGYVQRIKAVNPSFQIGFSFVITWRGGTRDDVAVVENIGEIEAAARRAAEAGFDYISFKPFLERADTGSEIMDPSKIEGGMPDVLRRIRQGIDAARAYEGAAFSVRESTNLRMLMENSWREYTRQPRTCHMQALRQVLSPHGTFNCPAYRGVSAARLGEADAYHDAASVTSTSQSTSSLLDRFDASVNCRDVTCLYHETNWWLEQRIEDGESLGPETEDRGDTFL